jgi:hypothetical protein
MIENIISEYDKDEVEYDIVYDFGIVKENKGNGVIDVDCLTRKFTHSDVLLLGNSNSVIGTKGIIIYVTKIKYPCFLPFNIRFENDKLGKNEISFKSFGTLVATDSGTKESNIQLIIDTAKKLGIYDYNQISYILATAEIETGDFIPKSEKRLSPSEPGYANQSRYWITGFYGRGLAQLSWEDNYKYYSNLLKIDLVKNPDLVNNREIASYILCHGMKYGIFRKGNKLDDYINPQTIDFYNARNIVDGKLNKANEVKGYAENWKKVLNVK